MRERKGAETNYRVSHREKPVHREISLVFPSGTISGLDSNGKKKEKGKRKEKIRRLRIECWRFMGQRKPSYRSHVKPLANVCTVYVKKRQLVSSVNISTIHVCVWVYINRNRKVKYDEGIWKERRKDNFFFFFHQLPKVNQGFEKNLIKSKWIDVEMILWHEDRSWNDERMVWFSGLIFNLRLWNFCLLFVKILWFIFKKNKREYFTSRYYLAKFQVKIQGKEIFNYTSRKVVSANKLISSFQEDLGGIIRNWFQTLTPV